MAMYVMEEMPDLLGTGDQVLYPGFAMMEQVSTEDLIRQIASSSGFYVGDVEGVVQKIDVVYTTLTTADNRAVILPNGKLADSNIVNATKADRRRVDISVGIAYDAPLNLAKEVLMKIGESQKDRLPDEPIRVVVSELGDSAVILLIQLWVKPEDYWTTRWAMTEQIKKSFDEAGISNPFPQMDVHVVK